MKNPWIVSFLTAFLFGSWPLIARASGLGSTWIALAVSLSTLLVVGIASGGDTTTPSANAFFICLLAGAINGIGMLTYGKVIATSDPIMLAITLALIPLFTAVGGSLFFGHPLTVTNYRQSCHPNAPSFPTMICLGALS